MIGEYAAVAAVTAMVVLVIGGVLAMAAARAWLRRHKASLGRRRDHLWDLFYGLDWGETTTNNYGFAPAEGEEPERFQLQMYRQHLQALVASGRLGARTDLLEVSCGRGGGLAHLVRTWPVPVSATGLDYSQNALIACRERYGALDNLTFVHGSALALPFPDQSFDVVVNVEASNDYGDYEGFFREVRRVLRPSGAFLYCDTRKAENASRVPEALRRAGLAGEFRDITTNVIEACRQDSPRRVRLLKSRMPWIYWVLFRNELRSYAAAEGSRKFKAFVNGERVYVTTLAIPPLLALDGPGPHRGRSSTVEKAAALGWLTETMVDDA
jgi:SAM-dependent methyltransferase